MYAPVSWLRELVGEQALPASMTGADVAAALVKVGLEEEGLAGGDITGPLVVGKVLSFEDEPQKNGKVIRWCRVDVGENGQKLSEGKDAQEIVCGAHNFEVGDLVVVVLPGATLPGGFSISARKTYGHISNGMICAEDELGIGEDHSGIIVLQDYFADQPGKLARCVPGADAIELLGLADEVVEINVTPDRGYAFSMRGIARDLALSVAAAFTDPVDAPRAAAPVANGSGYPVDLADDAPIDGVPGCDRYVARVIRGIDVAAQTPSWMATRLTQMGMRPISLAVDVTNYVMLLTGQPLHAFDLDKLSERIVVRRARAGEKLTTLDDVERTLDPQDLLVTDGERPLVIAGVMGGETCEVDGSTTNVLVEAAHFDPVSVARSSRRHRLPSEAAKRFERGVDPEITAAAAQLAVELLVELGGGTVDEGVTDVRTGEPERAYVEMSADLPSRLVGLEFGRDEVERVLREIGCEVSGGDVLTVVPPSWRPDLRTGPDLVEEVARSRGYAQIPSVLPQAPGGRGLTPSQRGRRLVTRTLAQQGLVEVLTYPFTSTARLDALQLAADDDLRRSVTVANPLSEETPLLRTSVLATLLDAVRRNTSRGLRDVGVYELGLVYLPAADAGKAPVPPLGVRPDDATLAAIRGAVPAQPWHAAGVLTGDAVPAGPWGPARPVAPGDAVSIALETARALGVTLTVAQAERAPWHPGRCASLALADGTVVGHAGELHPKTLAALDLPERTCAFELDVDALVAAAGDVVQASKLSTYPLAHTDVALVVDERVPAGDVEAALRSGAGEDLESLSLFDVYRGDQLGEGKKSLAYRLSFRSSSGTLKTGEVSSRRDAAIAAAAKATGASQRA